MKFSFLILHYNTLEETEKCIDSIMKLEHIEESKIVVVDNNSPNHTGEILKEKYAEINQVEVILNKENEGFSKGNNIGYSYLKKVYNPQYVIVTNNDTIFPQKNFLECIEKIHKHTKFAVLGPDIYVPRTKEHQSPLKEKMPTLEEVYKEVAEHEYLAKHMIKYEMQERILSVYNKLLKILGKEKEKKRNVDYTKTYENALVSGACLIFSTEYISQYQVLFEPEVKFYFEESFLLMKCLKNHNKVVYSPEIYVIHNHRAATKKSKKNFIQKRTFIESNMIESGKKLIEMMEQEYGD